jgi:hypothetical protein
LTQSRPLYEVALPPDSCDLDSKRCRGHVVREFVLADKNSENMTFWVESSGRPDLGLDEQRILDFETGLRSARRTD